MVLKTQKVQETRYIHTNRMVRLVKRCCWWWLLFFYIIIFVVVYEKPRLL